MGGELWQHKTEWKNDPTEAFQNVQRAFLEENYDLPALIEEHLKSAREAVEITKREGDPYDLMAMYREQLAMLEQVSSEPLPEGSMERIELLRKLYGNSGEGIGNVLDVEGVSEEGGFLIARILKRDDLQSLFGTLTPTEEDVEPAISSIFEMVDRGESVCFPVYSEEEPVAWQFIGCTID